MMTVPMDSLSAPSSRELVQRLYKKNLELENKRRKSAQAKIPSDPNAWQQMRENFEAIILEDHAFSEQHEIEYALWQLHYRRIDEFRSHLNAAQASATPQVVKGPARQDRTKRIRSQFKTFLSEATGFYHDLILKIRAKYGLPLGHFSEDPDNYIILEKDGRKYSEMKKGLMSCHRCLIYLGDLARYKGHYGEGDSKTRDYAAASSYYMQAASLWPSSGNPHHQLAILASYLGDDLVAIYRYFRSLAVNNPFSTARDNLIIAFEKNRQSYSQLPGDVKSSVDKTLPVKKPGKGRGKGEKLLLQQEVEATPIKEKVVNIQETYKGFCIRFVRLNGILFTRTSLETFGEVFSLVRSDLHELLSSGPEEELIFGLDVVESGLVIVRLVAVLIFTVHNVSRETEGQSYADILQRSVLLQNGFTASFEFMGHIIERCIQMQDPSSSYLLPGILVFVEWLACRPDIAMCNDMEEKQSTARSFFWTNCTSFFNKLISSKLVSFVDDGDDTCFFNMSRYDEGETDNRLALWEDVELRGFLPLLPAQVILDFSRKHAAGVDGGNKEKRARVQRILAAGRALTSVVRIDQKALHFDQKMKKFIIGVEYLIPDESMPTRSLEMGKSNGMSQEYSTEMMRSVVVVPPKAQLYLEGEEEDEEIVFKPTVTEKLDIIAPKLTQYEVHRPGENISNGELTSYAESIPAPPSNFSLQNALDINKQLPAPFSIASIQHQPITSVDSNWHVEQHAYLANGMKSLSIAGTGFVRNTESKNGLGYSQPPALSLPFQQPSNPIFTGGMVFDQTRAAETVIPSKFDSVMSLGMNAESLPLKPSGALQTGSRKNPVSRPVRHLGPPPGFSHVPSKPVDAPVVGSDLKNENSPLDDYSWLDGYQMTSSAKVVEPNSVNDMVPLYPQVMNSSNGLMTGATNFPFPGKQVPALQAQIENEKTWHDHKLLEHLKLYQEEQQLLQQANQQSAQGQSLWSGHFFV